VAGFEIYFDGLEDCATRAKGVANQFKSLADEVPPSVGASCFGDLEGFSDKLVKAVNDLEAKIEAETRHAEQNLTKVEAAIHKVVDNVRKADPTPGPRTEQA
jgi:flagellar hook-basal body complex protein FliE